MASLATHLEPLRLAFRRLNAREQTVVIAGSAVGMLVIMLGVGLGLSSAISRAEHRVSVKTDQLMQLLALQGEYKARERDQASRMASLGRANVRLVSLVEDAAGKAGVSIGQLRPDDGEPNEAGVIESRVDLRASGLSVDRLQRFLNLLAASPGLVIMRRLTIDRPYRKEMADVELTITTFKVKD